MGGTKKKKRKQRGEQTLPDKPALTEVISDESSHSQIAIPCNNPEEMKKTLALLSEPSKLSKNNASISLIVVLVSRILDEVVADIPPNKKEEPISMEDLNNEDFEIKDTPYEDALREMQWARYQSKADLCVELVVDALREITSGNINSDLLYDNEDIQTLIIGLITLVNPTTSNTSPKISINTATLSQSSLEDFFKMGLSLYTNKKPDKFTVNLNELYYKKSEDDNWTPWPINSSEDISVTGLKFSDTFQLSSISTLDYIIELKHRYLFNKLTVFIHVIKTVVQQGEAWWIRNWSSLSECFSCGNFKGQWWYEREKQHTLYSINFFNMLMTSPPTAHHAYLFQTLDSESITLDMSHFLAKDYYWYHIHFTEIINDDFTGKLLMLNNSRFPIGIKNIRISQLPIDSSNQGDPWTEGKATFSYIQFEFNGINFLLKTKAIISRGISPKLYRDVYADPGMSFICTQSNLWKNEINKMPPLILWKPSQIEHEGKIIDFSSINLLTEPISSHNIFSCKSMVEDPRLFFNIENAFGPIDHVKDSIIHNLMNKHCSDKKSTFHSLVKINQPMVLGIKIPKPASEIINTTNKEDCYHYIKKWDCLPTEKKIVLSSQCIIVLCQIMCPSLQIEIPNERITPKSHHIRTKLKPSNNTLDSCEI